jgi:predicted naringenin-chalcone synthase
VCGLIRLSALRRAVVVPGRMLETARHRLPGGTIESPAPVLAGLALTTPDVSYSQDEMLDLLGLRGNAFAEEIFAACGVRTRHLDVSADSLRSSLQARTATSEDGLFRLAVDAVAQLDFDPSEIGVLVTATYYSLGGPTLGHRLMNHYGLDPATDKYHLVGVGCASAVPLLRLAAQSLRARPSQKALIVAAESVSGFLTSVDAEDEKVKVVGSALFGDGCAAALLAGVNAAEGPAVAATAVHQVPGTLDYVRFAVTGEDSHMRISRELPAIAATGLEPLVDDFLAARGLDIGAIDHWLVHPGGRGIVEGVRSGLGLTAEQIEPSVRVLAEHGNVGTPASFFVLGELMESRRPGAGELGCMVTIGPGVTIGLMLLEW